MGTIACPQRTAVWVEPGSSQNHLVLRIADRVGGKGRIALAGLRVDRCGDSNVGTTGPWIIHGMGGTSDSTVQVVYGEVPAGFEETHPAEPLASGCYEVTISGNGRTRFDVLDDGTIAPRPQDK